MDKNEIKRKVSIEQILGHYGRTPVAGKKMQCLFPEKHNNLDAKPSMELFEDRVFCRSQGCFGDKGADIFAVVRLKENLQKFTDQKKFLEKAFGLRNEHTKPFAILRSHQWEDAQGRTAYHLRSNDPQNKFTWNSKADGSGTKKLAPCQPDLFQRDAAMQAQSVIVGAGERDCDTMNGWLKDLGKYPTIVATCNHTGENCVKAESFHLLHDKELVYVIGDNDKTGEEYRDKVCGFLLGNVPTILPVWVPRRLQRCDGVG